MLIDMDSVKAAEHLTMIEWRLFCAIAPEELIIHVTASDDELDRLVRNLVFVWWFGGVCLAFGWCLLGIWFLGRYFVGGGQCTLMGVRFFVFKGFLLLMYVCPNSTD